MRIYYFDIGGIIVKKILSVILAIGLCLGLAVTAAAEPLTSKPTASLVLVNGAQTSFDAYNIADNNYFKLRDLAFVLSGTPKQFEVGYDDATKAITLTSGQSYTAEGGEMEGSGAGNKAANPTSSKIYLDGAEISLTAYNIGGYNYFKLRDIGQAFDFGVDWDGANNTIAIDTSKGYTPEAAAGGAVEYITIKGKQYSTSLTDFELGWLEITNADIEMLKHMTNLTYLDLRYNQISDLNSLAGLTNLTELLLFGNQITDISPLTKLTNLTILLAEDNQISDITALAELSNLVDLDLRNNNISDIGALSKLTNLEYLSLGDNPLTQTQIDELQKALPNCEISFSTD
jgi:hypothetical protein